MIRKISTQDVVSKRNEEESPKDSAASRRERDFLIERLTRKHATASIADSPVKVTKQSTPRRKTSHKKHIHLKNRWIWLTLPLVIIAAVLVVMQLTEQATVTVTPKQMTVPIDAKLAASLTASTSPTALTYHIITLKASDSETVTATGTTATKPTKASGQITIFNSFSSAPQTLIKNTRFETADGLIFRIQENIKVPGYTTSGGKIVPGSLTVTVVADQFGSQYNVDNIDFSIPGFQNDLARYNKIFARSKTAMTGGSDGNAFGVSEEVRVATQQTLQTRLKAELLRQAQSQKTANSVIFDSATKITFQHMADTAGVDSQHVVINEQGTISAIVFDKKTIGKLLLADAIAAVGNSVEVRGMEGLHFIATASAGSSVWEAKPFDFTLNGSVDVVGVIDTKKLLDEVRGVPKTELSRILSGYPTIDKASASIRPFWKSAFPDDASRIKIVVLN